MIASRQGLGSLTAFLLPPNAAFNTAFTLFTVLGSSSKRLEEALGVPYASFFIGLIGNRLLRSSRIFKKDYYLTNLSWAVGDPGPWATLGRGSSATTPAQGFYL